MSGTADRDAESAAAGRSDAEQFQAQPGSVDSPAPAAAKAGSFEPAAPVCATLRRGPAALAVAVQGLGLAAALALAAAFAAAFAARLSGVGAPRGVERLTRSPR